MSFYDHSKEERAEIVQSMLVNILAELRSNCFIQLLNYFTDEDTYIRKNAYLIIGKLYKQHKNLQQQILNQLSLWKDHPSPHMRQTIVNAAGEIGKENFDLVVHFFDEKLFDDHHSVRNAVIGSIKKMSEVNTQPVLQWAKKYLHHPDKEIRREICHGIELRGRKYPEDILPLLEELEFDQTSRVRKTLIHVLGQIAYKKGCLETVIQTIRNWKNQELVQEAIYEIIDVHYRYRNFSFYTQKEAEIYIQKQGYSTSISNK